MNKDNIEKLPKTLTKEMFICLGVGGYNAGDLSVLDFNRSVHNEDYIFICTKKVTFKIPQNIDVKGKVIESLEAEKEKLQADFHMKIKGVQDKIDNLLAIEYKPT